MLHPRIDVASRRAKIAYERIYAYAERTLSRPEIRSEWEARKPARLGMLRKTVVACSCFMCGNPRRYGRGGSVGEVREHERMKEQTADFFASLHDSATDADDANERSESEAG